MKIAGRGLFTRRRLICFVLVFVALVGGATAYLRHRYNLKLAERQAVAECKEVADFVYDYEYHSPLNSPVPYGPFWLRQWLGDDVLSAPVAARADGPKVTEALAKIGRLSTISDVDIDALGVPALDESLQYLSNVRDLQRLKISHGILDGSGLKYLSGLKGLNTRRLVNCELGDQFVAKLVANVPHLETFEFTEARTDGISEKDVTRLASLPRLKSLVLADWPYVDLANALAGATALQKLVVRRCHNEPFKVSLKDLPVFEDLEVDSDCDLQTCEELDLENLPMLERVEGGPYVRMDQYGAYPGFRHLYRARLVNLPKVKS